MFDSIGILLLSLGIILIGAEVFTNGVEWLGYRLHLPEGAVGSVLAAVGTALPETAIPIIAFLFGGGSEARDIGIGAIIGAPLMLATLAMFITGLAVVIFAKRRQNGMKVAADHTVMKRDLGFFLIVFTAAILTGFLPIRRWQLIIGGFMVFSYIYYVWATLQEEQVVSDEELRPFYFAPRQPNPKLRLILMQLIIALILIVGGAHLFVGGIKEVAGFFGIPPFVLALVIAPIATELPEKFNSVIWISRGKDTLALGNITGAMAFQSSLIPAFGIFLSDWRLGMNELLSGLLALIPAGIIYLQVRFRKHISVPVLFMAGAFYIIFFILVIDRVIR